MLDIRHPGSLYVGGEWIAVPGSSEVINPADESVLAVAPVGELSHLDAAIAAAREAFDSGPWPRLAQSQRQTHLNAFLDAAERRREEIVAILV